MRTVSGAKIVITGAGSGMGLLYAKRAFAEHANAIALWDRDAAALNRLLEELGHPTNVKPIEVDLADLKSISLAARETTSFLGTPDILINNAGIVRGNSYFWETDSAQDNDMTIRVNTLAPMHVTREFLPSMIAEPEREKRILNVASAAATVSNPRMSVYAASKWAMYGWSDSVRLELVQAGQKHVKVTTFCPSYVSTGMFEGARGMFLTPVISPQRAVDQAWRAMLSGKPVQLTPWAVNLAKLLKGVLPLAAWDKAANWMGVYRSMKMFTGRTQGKAETRGST